MTTTYLKTPSSGIYHTKAEGDFYAICGTDGDFSEWRSRPHGRHCRRCVRREEILAPATTDMGNELHDADGVLVTVPVDEDESPDAGELYARAAVGRTHSATGGAWYRDAEGGRLVLSTKGGRGLGRLHVSPTGRWWVQAADGSWTTEHTDSAEGALRLAGYLHRDDASHEARKLAAAYRCAVHAGAPDAPGDLVALAQALKARGLPVEAAVYYLRGMGDGADGLLRLYRNTTCKEVPAPTAPVPADLQPCGGCDDAFAPRRDYGHACDACHAEVLEDQRKARHARPYADRLLALVDRAEALASKYNQQAEAEWDRSVYGSPSDYDRVQAMADHHDDRMERLHALWVEHPDRTTPTYSDACRHCGLHHNPARGGRLHHDGTGFACAPDAPNACDFVATSEPKATYASMPDDHGTVDLHVCNGGGVVVVGEGCHPDAGPGGCLGLYRFTRERAQAVIEGRDPDYTLALGQPTKQGQAQ